MKAVKFTDEQLHMVIYELDQSIRGDNDSYDRKLKTIIKKLKETQDGEKSKN